MATYAFSDLHAQYNLWEQIRDFLKPEDRVFCLGDCIDRGDIGLQILDEIMAHPQITLLRGNHEDFILSVGGKMINLNPEKNLAPNEVLIWLQNGAAHTIQDFLNLSFNKRKQLVNKIKKLPTHFEYTNKKGDKIYLTHAGKSAKTREKKNMDPKGLIPTNNFVWDRTHIYQEHWDGEENEYVVHGHTPVAYIRDYLNLHEYPPLSDYKIYSYCDKHKIDIDLGSFLTHTACLLNLDTFEPIYFEAK